MRWCKLGEVKDEYTSHTLIHCTLPCFCQKFSQLVEIWQSSGKNNFAQCFWDTVINNTVFAGNFSKWHKIHISSLSCHNFITSLSAAMLPGAPVTSLVNHSCRDSITHAQTNNKHTRCCVSHQLQESAAYATVSARQCRHLANTFEAAAIECLTGVAT